MSFIFSTPVLIRYVWQLKSVAILHWCLIRAVLLNERIQPEQVFFALVGGFSDEVFDEIEIEKLFCKTFI
jgi:hypothetical protein